MKVAVGGFWSLKLELRTFKNTVGLFSPLAAEHFYSKIRQIRDIYIFFVGALSAEGRFMNPKRKIC